MCWLFISDKCVDGFQCIVSGHIFPLSGGFWVNVALPLFLTVCLLSAAAAAPGKPGE